MTGEAGTGKSFVIRHFLDKAREEGIPVGITASTGVSALNIGGSTIHAFCGIGLGEENEDVLLARVMQNHKVRERIKRCRILFIDEISMITGKLLDKIDYIFKGVRLSKEPFGGMKIVAAGDCLQLPPVFRDKDEGFFFESDAWEEADFNVIVLDEIIRQEDQFFRDMLSKIRVGELNDFSALYKRIGVQLPEGKNPIKLYSTNKKVDEENRRGLAKIKSEQRNYLALDDGPEHHLKSLDRNCLAPKNLQLKVGAKVMLLRNLDLSNGLCNGATGKVVAMRPGSVDVKFNSGIFKIEKESWEIREQIFDAEGNSYFKVLASRSQIPLKLAFAISIHKAQSATFDHAYMDLANCFEFGQVYVALSRVRSLEGLSLLSFYPSRIKVNQKCLEFYGSYE